MVDLSDICGDVPERARLIRKRQKVLDRIEALTNAYDAKTVPLKKELTMYDEMIAAIDRRCADATV